MRYEGYPVYNNSGLSIIEQSWRNQELHQYRRPLFSLNNSLGGDVVNLRSGSNVIHYLENNAKYEMEKVNDIQVGYHLKYLDNATHSLTLEPARSEEHTSELQSRGHIVCRLLLEKKKSNIEMD